MDNRNYFFIKPSSTETFKESVDSITTASEVVTTTASEVKMTTMERSVDGVPSTPIAAPVVATPAQPNWLSRIIGNATILQLVLLGVVFFMGNQLGSGCQKQKQIRQQINALEKMHVATLKRADSLYAAALQHDLSASEKVGTLYGQIEKLNIKDNTLKVEIAKTKQDIKTQSEGISTKIQNFKTERINTEQQGLNAFGYVDDED
jgi:hypothetical protein